MQIIKLFFFLLLAMAITSINAFSQSCLLEDKLISEGNQLLNIQPPDYYGALQKYQAAGLAATNICDITPEKSNKKVEELVAKIDEARKESELQRQKADKQTQLAEQKQKEANEQASIAEQEKLAAIAFDLTYKAENALEKGDIIDAYRIAEITASYIYPESDKAYQILNQIAYDPKFAASYRSHEIITKFPVISAKFSSDGAIVAFSSENSLMIWDNASKKYREFGRHENYITDIEFSPDGKSIATSSWDKSARIWDMQTSEYIEFKGYQEKLNNIAFSPDGKKIAAISDSTIVISDITTKEMVEFRGGIWAIQHVAFSPDSKLFAFVPTYNTVRICDIKSKKCREFEEKIPIPNDGSIRAQRLNTRDLAFSPDGKFVITGSNDEFALMWNIKSGRNIKLDISELSSLDFSYDGKFLATTNGSIELWDISSRKPTKLKENRGGILNIKFSKNSERLVTSNGSLLNTSYGQVTIWDITTDELIELLYPAQVIDVDLSPDGSTVLATFTDNTMRLWDLDTMTYFTKYEGHEDRVVDVEFSHDGKFIATASWDNTSRIWDVETGRYIELKGHTESVNDIEFSPDGKYAATASNDNTALLWDINPDKIRRFDSSSVYTPDPISLITGDTTAELDYPLSMKDIEFSYDGKMIAGPELNTDTGYYQDSLRPLIVNGINKIVSLYNLETSELLRQFKTPSTMEYHPFNSFPPTLVGGELKDLEFSPDGSTIAAMSYHEMVRIWNIETGDYIELEGYGEEGFEGIEDIEFSPDGRYFVVSATNGISRLFDTESFNYIELKGQKGAQITDTEFSPDSKLVAIASVRDNVWVWDIKTKEYTQLRGHTSSIKRVVFSSNGKFIGTASNDKTAKVWDIKTGEYKEFNGHDSPVTDVEFSPDGDAIVTASDNTARVYELTAPLLLNRMNYQYMPGMTVNSIRNYDIVGALMRAEKWKIFVNNASQPQVLYRFGKYFQEEVGFISNIDKQIDYIEKGIACYKRAYELSENSLYSQLSDQLYNLWCELLISNGRESEAEKLSKVGHPCKL